MNRTFACLAVTSTALFALALATTAQEPDPLPAPTKVVVGTFDSRALAVAWVRSKGFERELAPQREEYERAKKAGDDDRVAAIDARMQALQDELHKQGFGTWPVDNILARIEGDLPRIAKEAGVNVIVCRWNVVYRDPALTFVDVSVPMIAPFEPSEETLALVAEVLVKDPVPLAELEHSDD